MNRAVYKMCRMLISQIGLNVCFLNYKHAKVLSKANV